MKMDFTPNYLYGDMHLKHSFLFKTVYSKFFATEEEFLEETIKRWNKKIVSEEAIVLVFGDLGHKDGIDYVLPKLRGRKWLIIGNHDNYPIDYYEQYFEKVFVAPFFINERIVASHRPIPVEKGVLNIHSHTHEIILDSEQHLNICPEHWNFTPVLYKKVTYKFMSKNPKPNHKFLYEWYADKQITTDKNREDLSFDERGLINVQESRPKVILRRYRISNPDSDLSDKEILSYFLEDDIAY